MSKTSVRQRWVRVAAWLLAISYGIGAPLAAVAEGQRRLLSERFDIPPVLVYTTCVVQLACAIGVLVRPLAA